MTATDLAAHQAQVQDQADVHAHADAHDEAACPARQDPTRRRAVFGMAVAVGAVCAGCSSSKSSSAAAGGAASSAGVAAGSTSPAAGTSSSSDTSSAASSSSAGSAASSSSSGSAGSSAALAATSTVPVGGGTVLADQQIVLTQPSAGTFKAFTAVCTHMGCTVGSVANGLIVCPCHGSSFHIADGSVATGPASKALDPIAIKVSGGQITKA